MSRSKVPKGREAHKEGRDGKGPTAKAWGCYMSRWDVTPDVLRQRENPHQPLPDERIFREAEATILGDVGHTEATTQQLAIFCAVIERQGEIASGRKSLAQVIMEETEKESKKKD